MKTALLTAGGLGLAVGVWFAYFWLEERRKWGRPIRVDRFPNALLARAATHMDDYVDRYFYNPEECRG